MTAGRPGPAGLLRPFVAAGSAGTLLGAGLTHGGPGSPDRPWCGAALLGLAGAVALLLVLRSRPAAPRAAAPWAAGPWSAVGLLLVGCGVPAAVALDSPLVVGPVVAVAVFAGAAAARFAGRAALAGALAGAVAGAAAPALTAAVAGGLASTYGLLLLAAAACEADLAPRVPTRTT
ncbi:hypothetical protein GCM10009664_42140 [Kitasatospora gansuensis]